ncbi:FkbM family methyltransferase [Luminiphilus sp.]|nr:FkbM family methyltransferase [Luminiphilus sp.]
MHDRRISRETQPPAPPEDFSVGDLIDFLWKNPGLQNPQNDFYKTSKALLERKFQQIFELDDSILVSILGIGLNFPNIAMGNISSQHLFGIDELLILKFYSENKHRYKTVCDIGCNIGLHSKALCELGYSVTSFEPDPTHFKVCSDLLSEYSNIKLCNAAVSDYSGQASFTRILNNTTGSFINDKKRAYGPTEEVSVDVIDAVTLSEGFDLFKIDAEGSEVDVLSRIKPKTYETSDFILEISTEESRREFWELKLSRKFTVYSQKNSWQEVKEIQELPVSHREGSVFLSRQRPWCF